MADIHVQPSNDRLILEFDFQTPQQFGYTIILFNKDRNEEVYQQTSQWDQQTSFDLGEGDDLIGLYLIIHWTIIDPAGAGNAFSANATIFQNGAPCKARQVCRGQSKDDAAFVVTLGKIII